MKTDLIDGPPPRTADEHTVLNLSDEELREIDTTLQQLKSPPTSIPVTSIELRYPQKSHVIYAYAPATRGGAPRKLATFDHAGSGGGPLARTLELAVRYLDLLPVAVRLLQEARNDAHELGCVVEILDAHQVPAEVSGVPYSVHGRVAAALEVKS